MAKSNIDKLVDDPKKILFIVIIIVIIIVVVWIFWGKIKSFVNELINKGQDNGALIDWQNQTGEPLTLTNNKYRQLASKLQSAFYDSGWLVASWGTDEDAVSAILADFKAIYADICEEHTAPYEGILPLLSSLREQGIRVAVVSNKFDAATKKLCEKYFGDLVEIAVGERNGIRKKPAPDTVFEVLRLLKLPAASAIYIGDSDVDIETARAADMPCISVTWGFRDVDFLLEHGATVLVHTPEALLEILVEK